MRRSLGGVGEDALFVELDAIGLGKYRGGISAD